MKTHSPKKRSLQVVLLLSIGALAAGGCGSKSSCTRDCAGKSCGPDGCGGACGTCSGDFVCNADGLCEWSGCIGQPDGIPCGDIAGFICLGGECVGESCGDGYCTGDETPDDCAQDCIDACGDNLCTGAETPLTCAEDCPDVCGDGACTHAENPDTCPADCGPTCGDTYCTHNENAGVCPVDCDAVCGDGFCTHTETSACSSCPTDCPDVCGDGVCGCGEDSGTCGTDCPATCPNGVCDTNEDAASCPADCDAVCGDGHVTHNEQCDGGSQSCVTSCSSIGTQDCNASTCHWDACDPPAEVCNGVLDDCALACDQGCHHGVYELINVYDPTRFEYFDSLWEAQTAVAGGAWNWTGAPDTPKFYLLTSWLSGVFQLFMCMSTSFPFQEWVSYSPNCSGHTVVRSLGLAIGWAGGLCADARLYYMIKPGTNTQILATTEAERDELINVHGFVWDSSVEWYAWSYE